MVGSEKVKVFGSLDGLLNEGNLFFLKVKFGDESRIVFVLRFRIFNPIIRFAVRCFKARSEFEVAFYVGVLMFGSVYNVRVFSNESDNKAGVLNNPVVKGSFKDLPFNFCNVRYIRGGLDFCFLRFARGKGILISLVFW